MALINCPECNKQISDKANSCPNCGYPISPSESNKKVDYAQIRVVCKTTFLTIDGRSVSHGSIIKIPMGKASQQNVRISARGGAVGIIGSGINEYVSAGCKYDLDVHHTLVGRMLYLKEVDSFI